MPDQRAITEQPRKWYRAHALVERYGVSRQTIYEWRRRGILPAPVRIGPNVVAWSDVQLAEFEASRRRAS
jgi:predicted DNA-binding transcriptional regulator AlpA